jgi:hypothetical protein
VSLIFKIVGLAFEQFSWLKLLSLFTAYRPQKFISIAFRDPAFWAAALYDSQGAYQGSDRWADLVLWRSAIGYFAAAIVFHRRDLPAPL